MRVFSSAPIVNRYDVFTLETADGICVVLNGFVNKQRTNDNGFPSTVPCSFLFCSIFFFFTKVWFGKMTIKLVTVALSIFRIYANML
jgi:hypothetical protein